MRHSIKFKQYRTRRQQFIRSNFQSWSILSRADAKFRKMCKGHAFREWRDLYQDIKNTKMCSRIIFEKSIASGRLTVPSVNLFFQEDLNLLDGDKEGFEQIKMERVLAGIRRQILTVLFNEWASEAKISMRIQASACAKLQR